MKFAPARLLFLSFSLLLSGLTLTLSGCGLGSVASIDQSPIVAGAIKGGIVHGGPNPVSGSRVVIYATTSTGYGVGTALQEANQVGTSAHQDTDQYGAFTFAGGYSCQAGSYIYVVAYGGNSGAGNNPNAILMAALGSCSSLFSGTTYTGGTIWIDELTTVAAGYALSNFINVSGNALIGYTVGIGADTANSASTGCVANAYYSGCSTTQAAGMAHAFTTAKNLVSSTTGQANSVSTNGAIIPYQLINTLGNVLQACVNSTGGGTSASTGLPTTLTTSSGVSHDGTNCGRLSAYTSYTSNGTTAGTLIASGNTLGFIQNLAKRPGGTFVTFDSACDSNTAGTASTAASCIFNLASSNTFFMPTMTAAPSDWMLSIYYPRGSFSNAANTTACGSLTPATNGTYYPKQVMTDINDDIDIVNGDAATNTCVSVLSAAFDGTPLGASAFDNQTAATGSSSAANDSFGHTIVPVHGSSTSTTPPSNGVRIYTTGTDSTIALQQTLIYSGTAGVTSAENLPYNVTVDGNDTIWISGRSASKSFGYASLSGANSHSSPTYNVNVVGTATGNGQQVGIDLNNNVFSATSSSSGAARPSGWVGSTPATLATTPPTYTQSSSTNDEGTPTTSTSNGSVILPDASGNVWQVYTGTGTAAQGTPVQDIVVKVPYTSTATAVSFPSAATSYAGGTAQGDFSIVGGVMDGNNVMWWADLQGSNVTGPPVVTYFGYLHGFDTVNAAYLPTYYGCAFTQTNPTAVTAWSITSPGGTTFTTTFAPPSVGSTVNLSGFTTSTFFNGQQVTVTASNGSTAPYTFMVTNTFGQATSASTENGIVAGNVATSCGSNATDINYPSSGSYVLYGTRGMAIDSAGDIWLPNGTQGHITEIIGMAAPTWPSFIHNGTSYKP